MRSIELRAVVALVAVAFFGSALAEDTPTIVRMFKMVPKPGMEQKFEDAIKAHGAFRRQNGDPWSWDLYETVTGTLDGTWYARSGGHTWAEINEYSNSEFSQKAVADFQKNVGPLLHESVGSLSEDLPELSHWPEDAPQYEYFWVYSYDVRPGHGMPFRQAVTAIAEALKAAGYGEHWGFTESLTGNPSEYNLVLPAMDWSGFAEPETTANDVLVQAKGEQAAAEMWQAMFEHVRSEESHVYRRDAELSTEGAGN